MTLHLRNTSLPPPMHPRHQPVMEKYLECFLDVYDNVFQSPIVEAIAKKMKTLPERLVYICAEAVGGEVALLARRWEQGVKGIVENVVDGMNFDGKYSHLSE